MAETNSEFFGESAYLHRVHLFAKGHRSIKVPNACILSCNIERSIVLARIEDRGEHELMLDCKGLPHLEFGSLCQS